MSELSETRRPPTLETFLWERGVWLIRAPLALATEEERAEHARLSQGNDPNSIRDRIKARLAETPAPGQANVVARLSYSIPVFAEELGKLQPRRDFTNQLEARVLQALRSGALIAVGHVAGATSQEPQVIPETAMSTLRNAQGPSLTVAGVSFNNVRVLPRREAERLEAAWGEIYAVDLEPDDPIEPRAIQQETIPQKAIQQEAIEQKAIEREAMELGAILDAPALDAPRLRDDTLADDFQMDAAEMDDAPSAAPKKPSAASQSVARGAMAEHARDAFWSLVERQEVDFNGSFRRQADRLRAEMARLWPEAGYSAERPSLSTLRREVGPLFRKEAGKRPAAAARGSAA